MPCVQGRADKIANWWIRRWRPNPLVIGDAAQGQYQSLLNKYTYGGSMFYSMAYQYIFDNIIDITSVIANIYIGHQKEGNKKGAEKVSISFNLKEISGGKKLDYFLENYSRSEEVKSYRNSSLSAALFLQNGPDKKIDFSKMSEIDFSEYVYNDKLRKYISAIIMYFSEHEKFQAAFVRNLRKDDFDNDDYRLVMKIFFKRVLTISENHNMSSSDAIDISMLLITYTKLMVSVSSNDDSQKDKLNGLSFERLCYDLLRKNGFKVQKTPRTGDFGADLIASRDGLSFSIQCKSGATKAGIQSVQEAIAACKYYKNDYAVVVSEAGFTMSARELAFKSHTILCDHNNIHDLILLSRLL